MLSKFMPENKQPFSMIRDHSRDKNATTVYFYQRREPMEWYPFPVTNRALANMVDC